MITGIAEVAGFSRIFRKKAEPVTVGHRHVRDDDVGTAAVDLDERSVPARGCDDIVSSRLEDELQHVEHDGTVVHDEHCRSVGGRIRGAFRHGK